MMLKPVGGWVLLITTSMVVGGILGYLLETWLFSIPVGLFFGLFWPSDFRN